MSIAFSCECGKRLKVADNLLGKKVKCPDCQKVTVVSANGAAPPAKPVAKPVAAKAKAAEKPKAPVDDEPDLSSLLGDDEAGEDTPRPKKKSAKPSLDENLEPDLSSLLGEDEEEPKPAKKKPAKPAKAEDEDEEPDLSSLLGDDEEEAPPAAKKKKPAKPADEDDEPDLSSLLGDEEEEEAPKPARKTGKSVKATDMFETSLEDDEAIQPPPRKSKRPVFDEEESAGDEDDEDEGPRSKKKPAGKKSRKMLLIIILIVVLLLGGGAAVVIFFFPHLVPGLAPPNRVPPPPGIRQQPMPPVVPVPMKDGMMIKDGKDGKDGAAKDSATKDGTGKDGTTKDAATKDGASKDGTGKDTATKDAGGKDGANKTTPSKDGKEEKKDPEKKDPEQKIDANPTAKEIDSSIGLKLIRIEPGKFQMGSPVIEKDREPEETPHAVEITQPFYLGKFEVTQAQYQKIMGSNPSKFKGDNLPVENVTWEEAKEFCKKLSEREPGRTYELPTEAEWEYACRAGTKSPFNNGGDVLAPDQANFGSDKTTDVGMFKANDWGLFDMHGNVAEWCEDRFDRDYYKMSPPKDPPGPLFGDYRCVRGGSWSMRADQCRSACRFNEDPRRGDENIGFRVVLRLPAAKAAAAN